MEYAILCNPGHNRVYFEASLQLAQAEFSLVARKLSVPCGQAGIEMICDIPYFVFQAEKELSAADIRRVSELSFVYALFSLKREGQEVALHPIRRTDERFVDESIGTILKYTGKTNELFTRMLIHVAQLTQETGEEQNLRLLDPVAGKGTTLYEGLIRGFDVYGVEIGDKVTTEAYHFLKRFLETARYKFTCKTVRISGENKSFSASRHTFQIARNKEDLKNRNLRTAEFIAGNSMYSHLFFKKRFFHMIVGDLPYGVQHGNVTSEKRSSLTRNPSELLEACLPAWKQVLKPGGAVVLAWNSNVLSREKLAMVIEKHGFRVLQEGPFLEFEHRVDLSIRRDIIVAIKGN